MRRSEKEITDRAEIDAVIRRSRVLRLGLSDRGQPYVVPLCFGYDGRSLYFHCAREGKKMQILRQNNRVCVEFDIVDGVAESDQACNWSVNYQSVIGFGTAHVVVDLPEKRDALALLMAQYSGRSFTFPDDALKGTVIVRIDISSMTGKKSPGDERRKSY